MLAAGSDRADEAREKRGAARSKRPPLADAKKYMYVITLSDLLE